MRYLAPIPLQFVDESGVPCSGGTVSVHYAGNNTLAPIYENSYNDELVDNPVVLDSLGMWKAYVDAGVSLDYIVKNDEGNVVASYLGVVASGGGGGTGGVTKAYVDENDNEIRASVDNLAADVADEVERAETAEKAAKTEVVEGENVTVEETIAPDGHSIFKVSSDGAPQVQADWNQQDQSEPDYIKNKPTKLSKFTDDVTRQSLVESGVGIEKPVSSAAVNAGLSEKADKVQGATAGNLAALDANGNLADSGSKPSDFKTKQSAVSDPAADGSGLSFIDSVSQNANGEITPHKKTVQDGTTTQKGVVQLEDSFASTSTTTAATPNAVKSAYDLAATAVQGVKVNGTELFKDGNNKVDVPVPTASAAVPAMDGTASAGNSTQWARGDHRHPTDDSREAVANKSQTLDPTSTTEYPSSAAVGNFVNSSVATNTATFLGNFQLTDLGLTYPATEVQIAAALNNHVWPTDFPTNNDYVYVEIKNPQTSIDDKVQRYKYRDSLESWGYEYTLNNSSFTAEEKAAIDSGIDSYKVAAYDDAVTRLNNHVNDKTNPHNVTKSQVGLGNVDNTSDADKPISTAQQTALNAKQNTISDLATIRSGAAAGATALQPDGNGSNLSVTPDGTSTGYDLGSSTTLKVWAQKFKNLVGALKALAFKDNVGPSDVSSGTYGINISGNAATATTASNYESGGGIDTALQGKSSTSHTHSVKINGTTKTIPATGGTAVDLGTYLTQHQDISGKLDKTGDASNTTSTFTKASGDTSSMASGGKLSAIFTAISIFFASLKALAFKDKVSDSDISGTISDSHVASASTWNGKQNALPTTGTASTTYAIGISGNASTASTADKVKNGSNWTKTDNEAPQGLRVDRAYDNGWPYTYGNVITIGGSGDGQLMLGWSGTTGGVAPIYYRNRRDHGGTTWSPWRTIAYQEDNGVSLSGQTLSVKINGTTQSLTNTTYESKSAASGGTDVSLCTTGEKYTWNGKQNTVGTDTDSSAFSDSTTIATGFGSNKIHLNAASRLWTYIQGKISSVIGLTAVKYNGAAATNRCERGSNDGSTDYDTEIAQNTAYVKEMPPLASHSPNAVWNHLYTSCGADTGYAVQLAIGMTGNSMHIRHKDNGIWTAWMNLRHAGTWFDTGILPIERGGTGANNLANVTVGRATNAQEAESVGKTSGSNSVAVSTNGIGLVNGANSVTIENGRVNATAGFGGNLNGNADKATRSVRVVERYHSDVPTQDIMFSKLMFTPPSGSRPASGLVVWGTQNDFVEFSSMSSSSSNDYLHAILDSSYQKKSDILLSPSGAIQYSTRIVTTSGNQTLSGTGSSVSVTQNSKIMLDVTINNNGDANAVLLMEVMNGNTSLSARIFFANVSQTVAIPFGMTYTGSSTATLTVRWSVQSGSFIGSFYTRWLVIK